MPQLTEVEACYCTELIGNYLYVGAKGIRGVVIYCYDTVRNIWSTLPILDWSGDKIDCLCHVKEHLYVIHNSSEPHMGYNRCNRYNITTNQWESLNNWKVVHDLKGMETFCNVEAAVQHKSCLYVLCTQGITLKEFKSQCNIPRPYNSMLCCFDPKKNSWERKASTKTPHFGSSLLVVNNNLYVAGGRCSFQSSSSKSYSSPAGGPAAIEVYNDQNNSWSVIQQTCIPPNNLGAEEIEGRVYFIINSFPVDSGIRIPTGEVYPAVLSDWKNLGHFDKNAVLCSVPLKTENLEKEKENAEGVLKS